MIRQLLQLDPLTLQGYPARDSAFVPHAARIVVVQPRADQQFAGVGAGGRPTACFRSFPYGVSDDMKTALCLLTIISFVPLAVAKAADDAGRPKGATEAAEPKTAPSKWIELAEKNFKAQDQDGDGSLTFDEFKGKRKKPEAIEQAEQIFKLIDTDGDKRISLKEFINRPAEARFKQMDRDNDGKLTWEEFKGKREKPEEIEQAEQNFKRMDTNGDKCLSLEEFKAGQKQPAKPAKPAKSAKKAAQKKFQPKPLELAPNTTKSATAGAWGG